MRKSRSGFYLLMIHFKTALLLYPNLTFISMKRWFSNGRKFDFVVTRSWGFRSECRFLLYWSFCGRLLRRFRGFRCRRALTGIFQR